MDMWAGLLLARRAVPRYGSALAWLVASLWRTCGWRRTEGAIGRKDLPLLLALLPPFHGHAALDPLHCTAAAATTSFPPPPCEVFPLPASPLTIRQLGLLYYSPDSSEADCNSTVLRCLSICCNCGIVDCWSRSAHSPPPPPNCESMRRNPISARDIRPLLNFNHQSRTFRSRHSFTNQRSSTAHLARLLHPASTCLSQPVAQQLLLAAPYESRRSGRAVSTSCPGDYRDFASCLHHCLCCISPLARSASQPSSLAALHCLVSRTSMSSTSSTRPQSLRRPSPSPQTYHDRISHFELAPEAREHRGSS
jgi:hypothetical protein